MVSLESDITAQILNTCFQIVHHVCQNDNSTFDRENIEGRIKLLHEKVKSSSLDYNSIKGEFFCQSCLIFFFILQHRLLSFFKAFKFS